MLDGEGTVVLDGVEQLVKSGSIVHIPPGVVHGAKGRMRVLVVGIPDISDGDLFFPRNTDRHRIRGPVRSLRNVKRLTPT